MSSMVQSLTLPLPIQSTSRVPLIDDYLADQQRLTAVERFSHLHDRGQVPSQEKYYRDLIPLTTPGPGQQYAFEVDLDACTGCKACVAACHNLNGLDPGETWRDVGLLIGGPAESPIHQHVTAACHHCVEPACLDGCPVKAYEKDPVTGVVRHLDDQCIGCQYCILKCPYDAPKYNKAKGIVRKCDMCSDRLAVGEAPACVQACPNQAIRIRLVDTGQVRNDAVMRRFIPGAADPQYTVPTTVYRSATRLPADMRSADHHRVRPEHAHLSLVVMLVLTQLSVGALLVGRLVEIWDAAAFEAVRPVHAAMALSMGLLALAAATLHLGRPFYAFRAIIGLRTSWLSREILAFGLFAKLAMAYAALTGWPPDFMGGAALRALGIGVVAAGLVGVFCSAMIYDSTRRVFWRLRRAGTKFALTTLLLGLAASLAAGLAAAAIRQGLTIESFLEGPGSVLCAFLALTAAIKLGVEGSVFLNLISHHHEQMRRTAQLMAGPLHQPTVARFLTGLVGGVVIPLMLITMDLRASSSTVLCVSVAVMFILTLIGELLERYLFFAAVVPFKMPGGPG